jgi:hypothetical protein
MDEIPKRTINSEEENLKYLPFNIQWLDSSYQQTCLPDSPWQKVENQSFDFRGFIEDILS